ncbi:MAG: hypothetical protein JRD89_02295 [Deltaproteobacteria bacterium]|nr:hypothetical protein [Deltaproteobacteria bacterium]
MSYDTTRALRGWASVNTSLEADYCAGGQLSEPDGDKCCPSSSWNNGTYRNIKGVWSLRYHNEKRVRAALRLLLSPDGGLSGAAWDLGATEPASPMLQSGIERAAHNFLTIRPPDRWKKQANALKTSCTESGYYNLWTIKSPAVTEDRIAALQDALGSPLSGHFTSALRSSGRWNFQLPSRPAALSSWQHRELATVAKVPGGGAGANIDAMPRLSGGPSDLVLLLGASVGPGAWLRQFLGDYAPGWERKQVVITGKLNALPTLKTFAARPVLNKALWASESSESEDDGAGLGLGVKIALGIGAVSVVGVAAWKLGKR